MPSGFVNCAAQDTAPFRLARMLRVGSNPTYKAYCEATMEQVLGILPKPAEKLEARTPASMVFFDRMNHFEGGGIAV